MDLAQTEKLFRRLLKGGRMRRLPKSNKDAAVLLAVAASTFDPRQTYSEKEVNEVLVEWLGLFAVIDHVTVRRYMVDHSMLLRDPAGTNYRANQAVISSVIAPEVRSLLPADILADLERQRAERRTAVQLQQNAQSQQ